MNNSHVNFDSEAHVYSMGSRCFISVTSLIKKYIQPNKYSGVDPVLLSNKAEYGKMVHAAIEEYHMGLPVGTDNEDVNAYIRFAQMTGFGKTVVASEYIVSDEESVAGTTDQVTQINEHMFGLWDVKTTAEVDKEYCSWQLSIYSYLFEKQNPGDKVVELGIHHLKNGKHEPVHLDRIPDEVVESLIEAERSGAETWSNPLKKSYEEVDDIVARIKELDTDMIDYLAALKPMQDEKKKLEEKLAAISQDKQQKVFEGVYGTVTVRADSIKKTFSQELFKANLDEAICKYMPKGSTDRARKKQTEFCDAFRNAVSKSYETSTVIGKAITIKYK